MHHDVNRLRMAVMYPRSAGEEGYDRLEKIAEATDKIPQLESRMTALEGRINAAVQHNMDLVRDLKILMDHLGLEFRKDKHIVKRKSKGNK